GLNDEDIESRRPWVNGFIVKEASAYPSSWRGRGSPGDHLKKDRIVGVAGDRPPARPAPPGAPPRPGGPNSPAATAARRHRPPARALTGLAGRERVAGVTVDGAFRWNEGEWELGRGYVAPPAPRFKVVAYDAGIKLNILRQLRAAGCEVTVVPASAPAEA